MRPHLSTGPFPSNLTHSGPFWSWTHQKESPGCPTWAGRKPQHWGLCTLLLIPSIKALQGLDSCFPSMTQRVLFPLLEIVFPVYTWWWTPTCFFRLISNLTVLRHYYSLLLPTEWNAAPSMLSIWLVYPFLTAWPFCVLVMLVWAFRLVEVTVVFYLPCSLGWSLAHWTLVKGNPVIQREFLEKAFGRTNTTWFLSRIIDDTAWHWGRRQKDLKADAEPQKGLGC